MPGEDQELAIIPIMEQEFDTFDENTRKLRAGELQELQFTAYRLREGVYGQRQADSQMIRIKVPGGIITAKGLEAVGELTSNWAPLRKGHVTTREAIQVHHLKLEDASKAKRLLASVGMSSREACGNTVRNVVTCPLAGVCRTEVFDIVPYMIAYVRYFVRKPFTQTMPRKFKSSFSPCAHDCAVAPFHDIGFVAQMKEIDGVMRKGFRIHVGGGSSIQPKEAPVLYEFVPVEEFLRVCEAVLRVFNKSDELRKNIMMARIKVLVSRIGMDAFREKVEEELKEDWAKEPIDPTPYMVTDYETTPALSSNGHDVDWTKAPADFLRWMESNVEEQRQDGYYTAYIVVRQGDLSSEDFFELAKISREFGNGQMRTSFEQNMALRWVPGSRLMDLWHKLNEVGLGDHGFGEITDVTSCPGTDSCKMGITASMGMNRAVSQMLIDLQVDKDPLVRSMHVKISGCPNGCGRHHIADIGLQGAAITAEGGRQVPAYEIYAGGHYENNEFQFGQRIAEKVPSKRAPEAIQRLIAHYQANRGEGETFTKFVDRVGAKSLGPVVADLRGVERMTIDTIPLFQDWERDELYEVLRGEGECAAPVVPIEA
ncbi:MAG: nitrite/sulfite reductase [Chloroflexi bacterium]|nr:nitrite/sulfite reductase [Chloroflexota bacterium]